MSRDWRESAECIEGTFVYQAALCCEGCGEAIRKRLREEGKGPGDEYAEYEYDSDDFPKGPYRDGGGESDSPQHCDSGPDCLGAITLPCGDKIGAWLGNDLTEDGIKWLVETVINNLHRPDDHGRQLGRLWSYLYSHSLPRAADTLQIYKGVAKRNTVDECLMAAVSEGERGIINKIFSDIDHVYAVGWENVYESRTTMKSTGKENFAVWRVTALPDGNFSELEKVNLPASEAKERGAADILHELIEEDAWG